MLLRDVAFFDAPAPRDFPRPAMKVAEDCEVLGMEEKVFLCRLSSSLWECGIYIKRVGVEAANEERGRGLRSWAVGLERNGRSGWGDVERRDIGWK